MISVDKPAILGSDGLLFHRVGCSDTKAIRKVFFCDLNRGAAHCLCPQREERPSGNGTPSPAEGPSSRRSCKAIVIPPAKTVISLRSKTKGLFKAEPPEEKSGHWMKPKQAQPRRTRGRTGPGQEETAAGCTTALCPPGGRSGAATLAMAFRAWALTALVIPQGQDSDN